MNQNGKLMWKTGRMFIVPVPKRDAASTLTAIIAEIQRPRYITINGPHTRT